MKKKNKISLIFTFLALSSGSVWFGAYIARLLSTYQMFEQTEPILRNYLNDSNLPAVLEVISPLVTLTAITYSIMITSFILFLLTTKMKLKENGWLFIVAGIIFLTLPFEVV